MTDQLVAGELGQVLGDEPAGADGVAFDRQLDDLGLLPLVAWSPLRCRDRLACETLRGCCVTSDPRLPGHGGQLGGWRGIVFCHAASVAAAAVT